MSPLLPGAQEEGHVCGDRRLPWSWRPWEVTLSAPVGLGTIYAVCSQKEVMTP